MVIDAMKGRRKKQNPREEGVFVNHSDIEIDCPRTSSKNKNSDSSDQDLTIEVISISPRLTSTAG